MTSPESTARKACHDLTPGIAPAACVVGGFGRRMPAGGR